MDMEINLVIIPVDIAHETVEKEGIKIVCLRLEMNRVIGAGWIKRMMVKCAVFLVGSS